MNHKVAELEGTLLDAAVAQAEGWKLTGNAWARPTRVIHTNGPDTTQFIFSPLRGWSSDWQHGGPIVERERIAISCHAFGGGAYLPEGPEHWVAHTLGKFPRSGPTPLIAAMRAYCSAKFDEEMPPPPPDTDGIMRKGF